MGFGSANLDMLYPVKRTVEALFLSCKKINTFNFFGKNLGMEPRFEQNVS